MLAEALAGDVPLEPVPRDGFEGLHRGLECRLPGTNAGEGGLRLLARLIDAECVGCAMVAHSCFLVTDCGR